jgi:hypothetical protein
MKRDLSMNIKALSTRANNQSLTRRDIENLLLAYSGAVELDQIRIDHLPPASFHKEYDHGMWKRYRNDHLRFINLLLVTVPQIHEKTL